MPLSEADTRSKLIDPAIHKCGWTEDLIRREETEGTVEIINGKARRRSRGKIDYVLRVKVNVDTQPVALAIIEAKKEVFPPVMGSTKQKGTRNVGGFRYGSFFHPMAISSLNLTPLPGLHRRRSRQQRFLRRLNYARVVSSAWDLAWRRPSQDAAATVLGRRGCAPLLPRRRHSCRHGESRCL
jgi:hypothetical protein